MGADTGVSILGEPGNRDRLLSTRATADRLAAQGVGAEAAARFAELLATAAKGLDGDRPAVALLAPGRIEVLGKHTDYCGGGSLLAAVELGTAIVAEPRNDRRIAIVDAARGQKIEFDFDSDLKPQAGEWSNYPMTVARRLARNFPGELCGANIALASNLPLAAGMSSSSALVNGIFLTLAAINRLDEHPVWREYLTTREQLAGYCGTIENGQSFGPLAGDRGVGTFGGSEDHTAILCAVPGHLVKYSFCPIRREAVVPMPRGYVFVVMDSGVIAEKTGSALDKYNAVSQRAAKVLELWNASQSRSDATLADAIRSRRDMVESFKQAHHSTPDLVSRLQHFGFEGTWVEYGVDTLKKGDLVGFRVAVEHSQHFAETMLGNQVPATIELVKMARAAGAVAASSFGAGFGGSVWAMVESDRAADFASQWSRAYAEAGGRGRSFVTGAGTGVVGCDSSLWRSGATGRGVLARPVRGWRPRA